MKKVLITSIVMMTVALSGCQETSKTAAQKADEANQRAKNNVKAKATQSVPVPEITNFQARKNVAEYMKRLDEPEKVWYIYERAPMTGEILGYYTSSSYPQSICTFMTPPETVEEIRVRGSGPNPVAVTTSMALDGIYYKGGACPEFFFDYNTGAMFILDEDALTIAVDQPLDVGAPNLSIKKSKD